MRRLAMLLTLLFPVALSAEVFTSALSGANEVPPGDPNARGSAVLTFDGSTLTYTISVSGIQCPPIGQQIYAGPAGVNGNIFIDLPGAWLGCSLTGSTPLSMVDGAAIAANPTGYYLNVDSASAPTGAVRGQLGPSRIPSLSQLGLLLLFVTLCALAMARLAVRL
jgi:CHRD domain